MSVVIDHPVSRVRRLTINNVSRRGALSLEVVDALIEAVATTPEEIACLVLTGTGNTFCAGYDLKEVGSPPNPEHADASVAPDRHELFEVLERQPLPIVVALNGPAFGGGLELALACDIRVAVQAASLGAPAGRLGLVYASGGLERLMSELPFAIAADLLLAGGAVSAQRAYDLGLVSRIVDPSELQGVALAIATQITELAPIAVRANRTGLRALRRSGARFSTATRGELLQARLQGMRSADFAEGVTAFTERRSARFTGG